MPVSSSQDNSDDDDGYQEDSFERDYGGKGANPSPP
jgi:hypothetical protein